MRIASKVLVLTWLLAALPVVAQETKPVERAETKVVDPVVVTATTVPTPATQLGVALSVMRESDLKPYHYATVDEAMRNVPGVDIRRSGSLGKTSSISIRGANSNQVQVLVDGVRVKSPTLGQVDLSDLSPDLIERIEIIRGSQSTLYGADAMGGVVGEHGARLTLPEQCRLPGSRGPRCRLRLSDLLPDQRRAARGGVAQLHSRRSLEHEHGGDRVPARGRREQGGLPCGPARPLPLLRATAPLLRPALPDRRLPARGRQRVRQLADEARLPRLPDQGDGHPHPRERGHRLPGTDLQRPLLSRLRQPRSPARAQHVVGRRGGPEALAGTDPARADVLPQRLHGPDHLLLFDSHGALRGARERRRRPLRGGRVHERGRHPAEPRGVRQLHVHRHEKSGNGTVAASRAPAPVEHRTNLGP